ncbi:MAG: acyl-CoA thioesterase [Thermonemataceae bacterium]
MEKILKKKMKVRFQDCDPFNHLNNAKYIDYFINAREDQLVEYYDLDVYKEVQTTGKSWVVSSSQVAYLRPAHVMEEVSIESKLVQVASKSLLAEMRMFDRAEKELKSICWIKFIHYSLKEKRTARHSDELMALFESVHVPIDQTTFEERCAFLAQA